MTKNLNNPLGNPIKRLCKGNGTCHWKIKQWFDDIEDKLYFLYNIFRTNDNELIFTSLLFAIVNEC